MLSDADCDLLVRLLRIPTAGPLETGLRAPAPRLWEAVDRYADAATPLGFQVVHRAAADPATALRDDVPLPVRRAASLPGFLESQPSLVLRLGPRRSRERTVMCNVHLDTVAGFEPVTFDRSRFHGRGAIDAKGPAVALLAGIRAAVAADPAIGTEVTVLVQAVSGEEGGVMGTLGTRPLVEQGHVGRLNLFCEPTGLCYLPRATASATASIRVSGRDAIDDAPWHGHNATVLLGFLAQHLAHRLGHRDGVCVAGLRTGPSHNRVYGTGELLVNLAYRDRLAGQELPEALAKELDEGLYRFADRFADVAAFAQTARDCHAVTRLEWLKRDLPTLDNTDPWAEAVLRDAGVPRWPDHKPAFTCDAIWTAGVPGAFTAVLGPGDLTANRAHASGEFADRADLDAFAEAVAKVLTGFAARVRRSPT